MPKSINAYQLPVRRNTAVTATTLTSSKSRGQPRTAGSTPALQTKPKGRRFVSLFLRIDQPIEDNAVGYGVRYYSSLITRGEISGGICPGSGDARPVSTQADGNRIDLGLEYPTRLSVRPGERTHYIRARNDREAVRQMQHRRRHDTDVTVRPQLAEIPGQSRTRRRRHNDGIGVGGRSGGNHVIPAEGVAKDVERLSRGEGSHSDVRDVERATILCLATLAWAIILETSHD